MYLILMKKKANSMTLPQKTNIIYIIELSYHNTNNIRENPKLKAMVKTTLPLDNHNSGFCWFRTLSHLDFVRHSSEIKRVQNWFRTPF